jgi:hypothetical protein
MKRNGVGNQNGRSRAHEATAEVAVLATPNQSPDHCLTGAATRVGAT